MGSFIESISVALNSLALSSKSVDVSNIQWQSLSSELSRRLRYSANRISQSHKSDYAPITEELAERQPILGGVGGHRFASDESLTSVKGGLSWLTAAFLLVNTAMGAGILNFPALYHKAGGVVASISLQLVMVVILAGTMIILAYSSNKNQNSTYHDVMFSLCGRRAQQASALSIIATCYGICIAFLIVIGDQMDRTFASLLGPEYFCNNWFVRREFMIPLISMTIILPISYMKKVSFLKYISSFGTFVMLYPGILTAVKYYHAKDNNLLPPPSEVKTSPNSLLDILEVIPLICIAYQSHEVVVPVYSEMRKRNIKEFTKSTILALVALFFMYSAAGAYGYLTFGASVGPDIMTMYDANDPFVMIGLVMLALKMTFTYPPMIFCGRGAIDGLYMEFSGMSIAEYKAGEDTRRVIITTSWFFSTLVLALFIPDIGVVLELLGCIASANIFIYPGICLMMCVIDKNMSFKFVFLMTVSFIMILLGSFCSGTVLVKTIINGAPSSSVMDLLCKA